MDDDVFAHWTACLSVGYGFISKENAEGKACAYDDFWEMVGITVHTSPSLLLLTFPSRCKAASQASEH